MLAIVNVVAPIFALISLGYGAVRFKLYPSAGVPALVSFVNNFATPCLLFRSMMTSDFRSAFNPAIIGPFYAGAIAVMILGMLAGRKLFASPPDEAVASGFTAAFSNTVLVGLPVVHRAYGDVALPYIFSIIGLHAPLLLTGAMLVMEFAGQKGGSLGRTLLSGVKRIATNPLIWGIVAGVVGNFSGLRLPDAADAFFAMMSQAVVPAALFGIGGALNLYKFSENWQPAAAMTALKLIVHPLIAFVLMVYVLHVDRNLARYGVLLAAMPCGINTYVFATYYNKGTNIAANALLIGTVASAVTISVWLAVLS